MPPGGMKQRPTAGALHAASRIESNTELRESIAAFIDRETGLGELVELLERIIAEAGDLIESRSPELIAEARAAYGAIPMKRSDRPNDCALRRHCGTQHQPD
jgi:hypothetical protein